ncbi:MAG: UDP-N-acetylmuramate dehydrogenase [Bacteroidia bacterium]|nr:MAG: UDP-N-acetylmuramate dehydrogenase [Bacteroidia bacterium]
MQIFENHFLKDLNTFGVAVYAREYTRLQSENEVRQLLDHPAFNKGRHLIMGGGSNILFTEDYDGLVVHMDMQGKEVVRETEEKVFLKVQAGENWDDLVDYCVARGWGGLENLSLIPGQAGSSPIQNIGAYGVELKEHFHSLEAIHKKNKTPVTFSKEACGFGYRNSFFKNRGRNEYIILSVTFVLDKQPIIRKHYGSLAAELADHGIVQPGIADVREAVCRIRRRKLPDPVVLGNAGSFFKNPVVPYATYNRLRTEYPDLVAYPEESGFKLAAGWLIDRAGWKGYRNGDAGVHEHQALVLVNYGDASGKDLLKLASAIQQDVQAKYGVELQTEVNII